MRDSLVKSAQDTPGSDRYPKGSIVLCNACAKPIFKLDRGISFGDKAGKMASAFKPLSAGDLTELESREDVDAGVRAALQKQSPEDRKIHLAAMKDVRAGDPMLCPLCDDCFVQVLAIEKHEVMDRSYTMELLTIPPRGAGKPAPIRGLRLGAGAGKDWLH